MSVKRALSQAHGVVVRQSPTEVTVYQTTYGADDPRDETTQTTVTTKRMRAIFEPVDTDLEPTVIQERRAARLTYRKAQLDHVLNQGDRIEAGGVVFNIVSSKVIANTIVICRCEGPTVTPVAAVDETAPTISGLSITGGITQFEVSASFSEAAYWRLRYRRPPLTGTYITTNYSVGTVTSITDQAITGLAQGFYEVEIQAKDAAGNVSRWKSFGTVQVAGVPT